MIQVQVVTEREKTTTSIVICDPGVGNVRSVARAVALAASLPAFPFSLTVTRDPSVVRDAAIVVVPGQGAFGPFARAVQGELREALLAHLAAGKPYLGICLGMQVLFESSEEASEDDHGLAFFRGKVRRLTPGRDASTGQLHALPHIGWNSVAFGASGTGDAVGSPPPHFYFAHSYAAAPEDEAIIAGRTEYGEGRFASIVRRGNVLGVQFHPEKSQREGQRVLAGFFADARAAI